MKYSFVCGIETHVELATATKVFCGCSTAFGGKPNTRCCPVCTGQPGALPVLNKRAVEFAVRAGLALNCKINYLSAFDRKNYSYPDLPKAYQISQYALPLCRDGWLELESGKRIGIERIHLEEDAGKLVHERGSTFIDYNRGGVPLIEIVSKPDLSSPAEAREYIEKLQLIMRYTGVSDCKMQEGSMRCDVNISARPEGSELMGTRTEIKNMNSPAFAERAMNFEFGRQCELLERGERVEQATMRYDENTGETTVMRTKEDADDYRYFPEPDIPPVVLEREYVEGLKEGLCELPLAKMRRYIQVLALSEQTARLIAKYPKACEFFESALKCGAGAKRCANLITGTVFAFLESEENKEKFSLKFSADEFAELAMLADGGKINDTVARATLQKMLSGGGSAKTYLSGEDMRGVDEGELEEVCRLAVGQNPQAVADYLAGKQKAISALFGYVKRATAGKADIRLAEQIILKIIGEK